MKFLLLIFFSSIFIVKSRGQNKIYFINKTGRPVWIQKRTILGTGSFPYVLDSSGKKIQNIPINTESPAILNVVVVPAKGPYGTADGIYYLFKLNDTLIVETNDKNQPLLSHISSATRTKELSFVLNLVKKVDVTPFYTLIKTNPSLLKFANVKDLKKRDRLIDSLEKPYINSVEGFCLSEGVDPNIGRLYRNHYVGRMICDKLLVGYKLDSTLQKKIKHFYRDSLINWCDELKCDDCQNIFFSNLALKEIYKIRYGDLNERAFLDTISSITKGNTRNFLLSSYVNSRFELSNNVDELMSYYNSLCDDNLYKQMVQNNYQLHKSSSKVNTSELAMLLKADKSKIGFTQLISKLKGKVIYIDFWASWCKPCVEEIPFSHILKEKIKDKNIAMVYISLDTDFDSWKMASERFKINDGNSFVLINPEKNKLSAKIKFRPNPKIYCYRKNR